MNDVVLCKECRSGQTLDSAHALQIRFEPAEPWRSVIVWRDRPCLRPVARQRLRDLRAGDEVIYQGRTERVLAVEIYR